jgi:hypothetical protein
MSPEPSAVPELAPDYFVLHWICVEHFPGIIVYVIGLKL